MRKFFLLLTILAVAFVATANIFAQEAEVPNQLPVDLTEKPRTQIQATDEQTAAIQEQTEVMKKVAEAQLKATKENTGAIKDAAQRQADAVKIAESAKNETPWYATTTFIIGCVIVLAIAIVIVVVRRKRPATTVPCIMIGLIFLSSALANAAPCPAPFAVRSLTVVPNPALAVNPARVMVYPDQTRKLAIGGCGFGFNEHDVVVGFAGGTPVTIESVQDSKIVISVHPDVGAVVPSYQNLAVRIKGNLIRTDKVLEVMPAEAYAALAAAERHGINQTYRSGPAVDTTARSAATAAAHNATSAVDISRTAANAAVTLGTHFEQMFGKDGKGGTVGSEVVALRNEVDQLKQTADKHDSELFYSDGSSRIDDLIARVEELEKGGVSTSNNGITRAEFEALKAELEAIKSVKFKTGVLHSETIGQRIAEPTRKQKNQKEPRRHQVTQ